MTPNRSIHRLRAGTTAGALGLTALLTLGVASRAAAEPAWASVIFVGGGGIAEIDDAGTVVVEGPALVQDKHLREMLDATIRATMATTDSTLPAVDECEPATATFEVDGERYSDLTLTSQGTVCRVRNAFFPAYVTLEFDGLHEVVEAQRPDLRGGTGSLSINISPGGFTSLHADSFVPTT